MIARAVSLWVSIIMIWKQLHWDLLNKTEQYWEQWKRLPMATRFGVANSSLIAGKQCKALLPLQHGRITPSVCTQRPLPFGTVCTVSCHPGFKLAGVSERHCDNTGRWDPEVLDTRCIGKSCTMAIMRIQICHSIRAAYIYIYIYILVLRHGFHCWISFLTNKFSQCDFRLHLQISNMGMF